jgi:hypothetical protein
MDFAHVTYIAYNLHIQHDRNERNGLFTKKSHKILCACL